MKKNPRKLKFYVPWQHRFIAGLFGQLNLDSDRDVALYLQKESSFPQDGLAEKIFKDFSKGLGDFPEAWKKILHEKCDQQFIQRWENNLHQPPLKQQSSPKKNTEENPSKPKLVFNKQKAEPTKTSPLSNSSQKIIQGEAGLKPLPNSILRILETSLLESLEEKGKLNPRKLVRALNKKSVHYKIKRSGRTLFFSGKRISHQFDIPPEIELVTR